MLLFSGCDSGFGHALAKKLDSIGMRVFVGCLVTMSCYYFRCVTVGLAMRWPRGWTVSGCVSLSAVW